MDINADTFAADFFNAGSTLTGWDEASVSALLAGSDLTFEQCEEVEDDVLYAIRELVETKLEAATYTATVTDRNDDSVDADVTISVAGFDDVTGGVTLVTDGGELVAHNSLDSWAGPSLADFVSNLSNPRSVIVEIEAAVSKAVR